MGMPKMGEARVMSIAPIGGRGPVTASRLSEFLIAFKAS